MIATNARHVVRNAYLAPDSDVTRERTRRQRPRQPETLPAERGEQIGSSSENKRRTRKRAQEAVPRHRDTASCARVGSESRYFSFISLSMTNASRRGFHSTLVLRP